MFVVCICKCSSFKVSTTNWSVSTYHRQSLMRVSGSHAHMNLTSIARILPLKFQWCADVTSAFQGIKLCFGIAVCIGDMTANLVTTTRKKWPTMIQQERQVLSYFSHSENMQKRSKGYLNEKNVMMSHPALGTQGPQPPQNWPSVAELKLTCHLQTHCPCIVTVDDPLCGCVVGLSQHPTLCVVRRPCLHPAGSRRLAEQETPEMSWWPWLSAK